MTRAAERRTKRTTPMVLGAVEATAASAPEKADVVPSTPGTALGEQGYKLMRVNGLRCTSPCRHRSRPAPARPVATGLLHPCRRRRRHHFVEGAGEARATPGPPGCRHPA